LYFYVDNKHLILKSIYIFHCRFIQKASFIFWNNGLCVFKATFNNI